VCVALVIILSVTYFVWWCDKTHNTDEWSYGIEKDSVNFICHHKYCCFCCKTKKQMTKSQVVRKELERRLRKYQNDKEMEDKKNEGGPGIVGIK
jgi:hypothetical protein